LVLYKGRNNNEGGYYFRHRVTRSMGEVLGGASIIEDLGLDQEDSRAYKAGYPLRGRESL
jgi:hypothetical protein